MQTIHLDYEFTPKPRYGHGLPTHPELHQIIGSQRERYAEFLQSLSAFTADFGRISVESTGVTEPYWNNLWIPGLDAMALYGFLCTLNPARLVEIGSGNSTKFARRAIANQGLRTSITSIDPEPRAEIDQLCDRCIRSRLEDMNLAYFSELNAGDILFFDGSHRTFMNSDVTVFFLELLPRLRKGVIVQIHDIALPDDYPPSWNDRYYSEQYLLACYLIAGWQRLKILMANAFVGSDPELFGKVVKLYSAAGISGFEAGGGSFWMEML